MISKIRYWWFNKRFHWVAVFIVNHKLWWNDEDRKRWKNYK